MGFAEKVKIRVWGTAQALCCKCRTECIEPAGPGDDRSNVGQCAHIVGEKPDAARHDPDWSDAELRAEDNGLLLCANCHKIVDDQEATYTVEVLRLMKEEHTRWLRDLVQKDMQAFRVERTTILHSTDAAISEDLALQALSPDYPALPVQVLQVDAGKEGWCEAASRQRQAVEEMKREGLPAAYAVFSLCDIPLCVHLGTLLESRHSVKLFQFDRDRCSWIWPEGERDEVEDLEIDDLPDEPTDGEGGVILRVSLSASVQSSDCEALVEDALADVHLVASNPSRTWLRLPSQLEDFGEAYRSLLEQINRLLPGCTELHVFAAVPTGAAIQIGRHWNRNMDPPLHLYQYCRSREPRYENVLSIR